MFLKLFAIMTGGGLGACFRYLIFMMVQRHSGQAFPSGTLAANLIGSLMIGFLWLFQGDKTQQ